MKVGDLVQNIGYGYRAIVTKFFRKNNIPFICYTRLTSIGLVETGYAAKFKLLSEV